ncbi:HAD-IC family P-type ATPase [Streptomyces sp. G1]|uniref:HAD-IC family P-type ATPase n=1 Tax=Streptomyces sp. G1 TaxID=361572 RepID=UPI0027E41F77|nr:HAD-IC family P-type ATPase [Streptomyces sp. G1]
MIVVNTAVGVAQEVRADNAVAALSALSAPNARVLRDSAPREVFAASVVPGDVLLLSEGDIVAADAEPAEASALLVDESMLTGESVAVDKDLGARLSAGTVVVRGRGVATVTATGADSALGRIAALLDTRREPTPLQRRLGALGRVLAAVTLALCLVVFVLGLVRGLSVATMAVTAISLAVAAVPESLPAVVTLALALGARRMRLLTERIEQITNDCLDAMEETGPAVDLVTAFAKPIPTIVICELLGVPYEDRASFQEQIDKFMNGETGDEELLAAYTATQDYLAKLVAAKRANPTDDVLSETANMLALGTFALLQNPEQLAALRADPALVDQAVEELLRYLSVAKSFMRTALEDVEVGGQTIEAGTTVVLSYNTANRDPERYADPHALDLGRDSGGHLAFGHGIHLCLGAQLARVEMRVAFSALLGRFPTLRLAVPAEKVALRPETADIYGVKSLPVTWDV